MRRVIPAYICIYFCMYICLYSIVLPTYSVVLDGHGDELTEK